MINFGDELNEFKPKTLKYSNLKFDEEYNPLKIVEEKISQLENTCEKNFLNLKILKEELKDKEFKILDLNVEMDKQSKNVEVLIDTINFIKKQIKEINRFTDECEDKVLKIKIDYSCNILNDNIKKVENFIKNNS